ncbi:hypothetical protein AVEN_88220-1 [Araneus ventricosus]|uniref:Uncharacterized protein n=1 Tax=Araneus ventricosus TaxID=182803 RepID=A0A4Y2HWV6_ARAVE|nr:hypothetical protein AVEN_88220-1 [Araneus ventricosus]
MTRTTPELAPPSSNFRTTPAGEPLQCEHFMGGMPLIIKIGYALFVSPRPCVLHHSFSHVQKCILRRSCVVMIADLGRGGLVVRSRLPGWRVQGAKPNFTEETL